MKNKNFVVKIFVSLSFLVIGSFIVLFSFFFDDDKNIEEADLQFLLQKKNFCILKITENLENIIYFTSQSQFVQKEECINRDIVETIPILIIEESNQENQEEIHQFLNNYKKMINLNPSLLFWLSDIRYKVNKWEFFLAKKNIRLELNDFYDQNWMEKILSMIVFLIDNKVREAYVNLHKDDTHLIITGEL
ncbi:MAG: hypothetical protein NZ853_06285 [Leptospiraceae bacterium]|nr:hypothetical protein [Leptospiraceae bacterium]MDW7976440.1 hypothetical protein [Leptospiraceae bacterium]